MGQEQKKMKLSDTEDDLDNGSISTESKPNAAIDETAIKTTKITDLNQFCLEKIFMQLDIESLFNVANANKWLELSAASVYGRRFRNSQVNVCSKRTCKQTVYMFSEYVCVDSLKCSLAFLRCFGEHIPEIILFCRRGFASADDEWLNRYMNEYCANTLQTLFVTDCSTISDETFARPFTKLTSIDFFGSTFGHDFRSLAKWFPALQRLKINAHLMDGLAMAECLPHLKHLQIPVVTAAWHDVASSLRLNPQLSSLEIDLKNDLDKSAIDVLDMIKGNPAISKLTVNDCGDSFMTVNADVIERFANEHPALIELILQKFVFNADEAIALIGRLNQLNKFQFRVNELSKYNELANRLNDEWNHRNSYVFNITTNNHHYSIDLTRKE